MSSSSSPGLLGWMREPKCRGEPTVVPSPLECEPSLLEGSMNSLNPVLRIGRQIADSFTDHGLRLGRAEAERRAAALLGAVGLPPSGGGSRSGERVRPAEG